LRPRRTTQVFMMEMSSAAKKIGEVDGEDIFEDFPGVTRMAVVIDDPEAETGQGVRTLLVLTGDREARMLREMDELGYKWPGGKFRADE